MELARGELMEEDKEQPLSRMKEAGGELTEQNLGTTVVLLRGLVGEGREVIEKE